MVQGWINACMKIVSRVALMAPALKIRGPRLSGVGGTSALDESEFEPKRGPFSASLDSDSDSAPFL
jgi:hypothetical protein